MQARTVTLTIAATSNPERKYTIEVVVTSGRLSLVEQTYPINKCKQRYRHLHDVPLDAFSNVQPQILIETDNPHLITPVEPVHMRFGCKKATIAVNTRLGWALQGLTFLPGLQDTP